MPPLTMTPEEQEINRIIVLPEVQNYDFDSKSDPNPSCELVIQSCNVLQIDPSLINDSRSLDDKKKLIKESYREKTRIIHPDKHQGKPIYETAVKAFKSLKPANDILLHAIKNPSFYIEMSQLAMRELAKAAEASHSEPALERPHLLARLFKTDEAKRYKEQKQLRKQQAEAEIAKKKIEEQLQKEILEKKQAEIAEAMAAEEQKKREQAQFEAKRAKQQQKIREQAAKEARISSCSKVVEEIRIYFLTVLQLNHASLTDITRHLFEDVIHKNKNLAPLIIDPLVEELNIFFDETRLSSKEFVTSLEQKQKLLNIVEYKQRAEKVISLFFNAQCLALSHTMMNTLHEQFALKFSLNINPPILTAYKNPPADFLSFVREFTDTQEYTLVDNAGSQKLLSMLNEYANIHKPLLTELIHFANLLRANSKEDDVSLSNLKECLTKMVVTLFDPTSPLFSLQVMRSNPSDRTIPYVNKMRQSNDEFQKILQQISARTFIRFSPTSSNAKLNSDDEMHRVILKTKLERVLDEYTTYSETNCRFSIFHRHGEAGRIRARNFVNDLGDTSSLEMAQAKILQYLSDKKNGNTHAHSFRTLLLQELLGPFEPNQFKQKMNILANKWGLPAAPINNISVESQHTWV